MSETKMFFNSWCLSFLLIGCIYGPHHQSFQASATDYKLPAVGELFEGDIVMDERLRRAVATDDNVNTKKSIVSAALEDGPKHWPGGRVPFDFDITFPLFMQRLVRQAIGEFNKFTCVRFVPRQKYDQDFVRFRSKRRGCSSTVGRRGGMQFINLGRGCKRFGTILHEMMHCIGFLHEHSRKDRDRFLQVRFENIKKRAMHNFRKYSYGRTNNLDAPYNYWSVMHYSSYAFSRNNRRTLVSKFFPLLKFGQRIHFSHLDIDQINRAYTCPNPLVRHRDVRYIVDNKTPPGRDLTSFLFDEGERHINSL